MRSSATKPSLQKPLVLGGLLLLLALIAGWILGPGSGDGDGQLGQQQEDTAELGDDRYKGLMASASAGPDPATGSTRKAVVTTFFGAVIDAATDERVPFLDLVVYHWPDWDSNLVGTPEQLVEALVQPQFSNGSKNGIRADYRVQTDQYGEFQVGLSELRGHIALAAKDGADEYPVAMAEGAYLWLETLAEDEYSKDKPLVFTSKVGPTIAINLTAAGERSIDDVLESSRLAAAGEAPEFFAYIDAGGDTRQGVDWHQVRHNAHPGLARIYLEAFTPAGFPQRISHSAPWIRLPAPMESDRKPNGKALVLHAQNRAGTLAGSAPLPGIVGIIPDSLALGVTERGVVEGKVLGSNSWDASGVRIHLRSLGDKPLGFDRGMGERLVTSEGGRYRLECVPEGAWQLQVWGEGSLLMRSNLVYEPGKVTEHDLDLTVLAAAAPEVSLVVELPRKISKEELRVARQYFRTRPKGDAILASFRPRDESLREIVPTIPAEVTVGLTNKNVVAFAVKSPPLPAGNYDLLLGRNPSSTSGGYFQWESTDLTWSTGGPPLQVQGYPVAAPWGWNWTDPLSNLPLNILTHFPMWWDKGGPIASLGLDSSPDAEAYLTRLAGKDWLGPYGQRLVGLTPQTLPVLEPQSPRDQSDLEEAEPLLATSGWGAAIKVRLHRPAGFTEEELGATSGFFPGALAPSQSNLPGAAILFDGAFATRTDGSGRALIGATLPPSRLQVDYPGYHQLEVKDDPTHLPLSAPPIDQLVFQVLLVRD